MSGQIGQIAKIEVTGSEAATIMSRGLAAGVVGGTVAAATGGNFENGMMTSAFSEMFNDELHKLQEQTAVLVHRPVDAPYLRNIKDDPLEMHTAIKFADGEIWGYYADGSVRLDPKYAGTYTVMSDSETEEAFGVKNNFDDTKMRNTFALEQIVWSNAINPDSLNYHAITVFPFWEHHNCNDFVRNVVQDYNNS